MKNGFGLWSGQRRSPLYIIYTHIQVYLFQLDLNYEYLGSFFIIFSLNMYTKYICDYQLLAVLTVICFFSYHEKNNYSGFVHYCVSVSFVQFLIINCRKYDDVKKLMIIPGNH